MDRTGRCRRLSTEREEKKGKTGAERTGQGMHDMEALYGLGFGGGGPRERRAWAVRGGSDETWYRR